jgi:hypothetical protein
MGFKAAAILAVAFASALATSANAASTDFSTIGTSHVTGSAGYSDGGVTLTYVGSPGSIWTTSQPTAPSGLSWYPDGGSTGYTDISLTGGGTFTEASLLVASGWDGGAQLAYALVSDGTIEATGDWGAVPAYGSGFVTATFSSSSPITDLWVQAPYASSVFSSGNFEALAIGEVTLTSAVPEPAAWTLALLGVAVTVLRKRKPARAQATDRAFA